MNHLARFFVAAMAITLLLLCTAPAFADIEVYMQAPTLNGSWWASQNDIGGQGNFATVYDNFRIYSVTNPYILDDVEWFGIYVNPGPPGNITGWTISIYADNAGQPGGALWSRYFGVSYPGYMEVCGFGAFNMCSYDMDSITGGYKLMPNTTYWLSVVPDMKFPPQWGWGTGTSGDGIAYQNWYGTLYQRNSDLAFNLQGIPTPEPGSLILMGTGILGLAGMLRRKLF